MNLINRSTKLENLKTETVHIYSATTLPNLCEISIELSNKTYFLEVYITHLCLAYKLLYIQNWMQRLFCVTGKLHVQNSLLSE